MKSFWHFYRWGVGLKYNMCVYGMALLFTKWFVLLAQGREALPVMDVFWMTVAGLLVAAVQYLCFERGDHPAQEPLAGRTAVWAVLSNAVVIGFSMGFGWFPGLPGWAYALLIAVLNFSLFCMWAFVHIARKFDTDRLNRSLRAFQGR